MGVPVERGHLASEAVSVAGDGVDRPVILAKAPMRPGAVADRVSWLTSVQPQTIWPTLFTETERSEPVDAWKARVFDRVLEKIDPDRLTSR